MGAQVLQFTYVFEAACTCASCGILVVMTSDVQARLRRSHDTFYCLNGHKQYWPGESDIEEAQRELREEQLRRERAEKATKTARKAEAIARGKMRAQGERIANGVCPCCNRSFQNLHRHMQTKHPKWKGDE